MEWTREQRYRRLEDITGKEYEDLMESVNSCIYRQKYHIQPKTGLLNDPNGFSYYNGEYHIFYQWFPIGPVHGIKYWYHMVSKDLVHWIDKGIGLSPDTEYESHGVFSGSGFVKDDLLYLFYTGNTRDKDWIRKPYQCLATMDKDGNINKYNKPLIIDSPEGYTDNFRDPNVFEQNGYYYCLIGAENTNNEGRIVYYRSKDLFDWQLMGEVNIPYKGGFMWECPDYFEIDDKGIIMFCSQGQEKSGNEYNNIFPSGYILTDKIDFSNPVVTSDIYNEFDRGFDFYAPQTMKDNKGRRILIGWLGLPGVECVTEKNNWAHCLTLPRELTIKNNRLYQRPIFELDNIKCNPITISDTIKGNARFDGFEGDIYYLNCKFTDIIGDKVGVKLRVGDNEETLFYYDILNSELIFDRSNSGIQYAVEYGSIRKCSFKEKDLQLEIFMDSSSVEIFVNDGLEVFTSRIYAKKESCGIEFFAENSANIEATICDIRL